MQQIEYKRDFRNVTKYHNNTDGDLVCWETGDSF